MNTASLTAASRFGPQLKSWRAMRGQSQMALALAAGVSMRHVSYLETGKASPSREMVVQLTQAMELPLRARNQLLAAAGFAPLYAETPMDAPALGPVRDALRFVLQAMEPNPTFIVNRRYELVDANETGRWVLANFIAEPDKFAHPINLAQLISRPEGMEGFIQNREEVQRKVMGRLRRDLAAVQPPDSRDERLLAEADRVLRSLGTPRTPVETLPLIAGLNLKRGELVLNLFTTIATIGTAQDVTLQETRIETLFPADAATRQLLADRVKPRQSK
jgi:transcriptional regulator with XRE-family HTH domain